MAWEKLKPEDSAYLIDSPAVIRENWNQLETRLDAALQITNAMVSPTANIEISKFKCTGGASGDYITLDANLNFQTSGLKDTDFLSVPSSSAQGDITYYNGSTYTRLPVGISGEVLLSTGPGANPEWDNLSSVLDSGFQIKWAGTIASIPSGWLFCDGSAIDRTTYANLFATIGTIYGVGNGTTTFNIPDLRDNSIVGAYQDDSGVPKTNITGVLTQSGGNATHTLVEAELPNHTHDTSNVLVEYMDRAGHAGGGGNIASSGATKQAIVGSTGSLGGGSHDNIPPYLAMSILIKT